MKFGILALLALGLAGIAGCEIEAEPYVPGPVAYDSFYWGGYYDGPYWVYRDRDGHYFRELRAAHESRERAYYGHVGGHESHAAGHAEVNEGGHGGEGHER